MKYKFSPADANALLKEDDEFPFIAVMQHGSMVIEYFAPVKTDSQSAHKQDEIYVIIKGDGIFFRAGERVSCKKGDILFVPAGMDHRFENFSADFTTWVIFYGPDGGETP
ncbi:MAG: cupin domain-containing protein [Chitinophagaceae bacterium]